MMRDPISMRKRSSLRSLVAGRYTCLSQTLRSTRRWESFPGCRKGVRKTVRCATSAIGQVTGAGSRDAQGGERVDELGSD